MKFDCIASPQHCTEIKTQNELKTKTHTNNSDMLIINYGVCIISFHKKYISTNLTLTI